MKIVAKKHVIQPGLEKAFSVAAKTAVAGPELQSVYAQAGEGSLQLTGSDTELTLVCRIEQVDVEAPGTVLLPPRVRDIVRACRDSDVTIEADSEVVRVTNDTAYWVVRLERGEYPMVPWAFAEPVTLSREILSTALARVHRAVASDENREDYKYIQVENGRMRGTDGNKFMQVEFPNTFSGLIPLRAAIEVARRLRGMALPEVQVSASERTFVFKFDDDFLIVNRHNANYPDVDGSLLGPALQNDTPLSLDRKATLDAIRRVAINADPDTNYMTVQLDNNVLTLLTLDKFGNQSRETLDINWPASERLLGVRHGFFADMLSAMTQPTVTVWLGPDDAKRGRLSLLRFAEEGFVGVLMQLRRDIGEAAKGSDRVRPAQQAPIGWGHNGTTADSATVKRARKAGAAAPDEGREWYLDTDEQFDFNAEVVKD